MFLICFKAFKKINEKQMKPYSNFITIVFIMLLSSCEWSTKPYIEHELDFKKIGDDCQVKEGFRITSNTNGERYELEQCLDIDFNKNKMVVERKSDTVLISFKDEGKKKASFSLTIDIDTYPRYNYLTIGSETYQIVQGKF